MTAGPVAPKPGRTNTLGKNDVRRETVLPQEIADEADMVARLHGKSVSEWMRDLIIKELRGEVARIRLLAGLPGGNRDNSR